MKDQESGIPADIQDAIEQCYQRCEAVVDGLGEHTDTARTPAIAYHYTDSAGLFGILDSGNIRLTDIAGLNDPTEISHGVAHACEILRTAAASSHRAARFLSDGFTDFHTKIAQLAHFFVACFSHNGNDLGQWRSYGNNGRGFSLGFDGELLERLFVAPNGDWITNHSTFSIRYNDTALRAVQTEIVNAFLTLSDVPRGRGLHPSTVAQFMRILSERLSLCAVRAALLFKHEAYSNEAEYRLLHIRPINDDLSDIKLRPRDTALIRFMEIAWRSDGCQPLREILIGPAADETKATEFAQICLRRAGIDTETIHIRKSTIPYRG